MPEAVRLTVQHRFPDVLELNRTAREQRVKAWLIMLVAAALAALGLWVLWFEENRPTATPVLVSAGVFLLLGIGAPWLAALGAWLLKARRKAFEMVIDPGGVTLVLGPDRVMFVWGVFRRWFETPNLLVLVGRGDSLAIPKRSC